MEQLVWAIIMIIFIVFTALKNRARSRERSRPDTDRTTDIEQVTREEADKLGKYMEELLGIKRPEPEPRISTKRELSRPAKERITPKEKPEIKKKVGQFESPLEKKFDEKRESSLPAEKEIYHAGFPWGTLSKKDLPGAIILSEIIGPPISKRKSHRLF